MNTSVPVLSTDGMRAWEQASWKSGLREREVITRVGAALASWLRGNIAPGSRLLLACGKGHNGDDVRAAVPHLAGFAVEVVEVRDPATDLARLQGALGRHPAVIIDGLFGIGLNRPLEAPWIRVIELLNQCRIRIVAMDVPSGLDADSGQTLGAAIRADWTLTVGAVKRGLIRMAAAEFTGRIVVLREVGLLPWSDSLVAPQAWVGDEAEFEGWPPPRHSTAHKGDFGHVVILAGSVGYHGAAVLAARGALRARPGLVTVVTAPDTYLPVASQLAAAMVRPWSPEFRLPPKTTAVVVGPGLADPGLPDGIRRWIADLWSGCHVPVVADASALDALPSGAVPPHGIRVVTPHAGEAGRLLGVSPLEVQSDRIGALERLSSRLGKAWVVLKGQGTLVGRSGELPWWNPTGNAGLAQGGSGDVLAGFLGASLAQPALAADIVRTLRGAVFRHGQAADRLEATREPWSAEDLARLVRW